MFLSKPAIEDLRIKLRKSYGSDFDLSISDEEVTEIGILLLTIFAEGLKHKVAYPELSTYRS